MSELLVILPRGYAKPIYDSGARYGTIDVKFSLAEQLVLVDGFHIAHGTHAGGRTREIDLTTSEHVLADAATVKHGGLWYRADPELHILGHRARRQRGAISLEEFRSHVEGTWQTIDEGPNPTVALTCTTFDFDGRQIEDWSAWRLDGRNALAVAYDLEVVDERAPLLSPLATGWPLAELAEARAVMIGLGSIGSAAAEALAAYGIRHFDLVDPDRLRWHNFARHRANWRRLGMLKVKAIAEQMAERDPAIDVNPLELDVIADADQIRPLMGEADIVIVSTDGVEPRRVANHLARRAGKPAVFGCVLEEGAFGEIHRFSPPRTGCLFCSRQVLRDAGAIDPEPALDRPYGDGTRHLPMTAVAGDLSLVGGLAAKMAVATLLEPLGIRDQHLAGDHAVISLRPKPDRAPPFDFEAAGEVHWSSLPPPQNGCPSCQT